jgi:D-3-phosphoglycerate dehydrogenase
MAERAPERLAVLVMNQISASGLSRLPAETYRVGKDVTDPAAILVRSAAPAPVPTTSRSRQ